MEQDNKQQAIEKAQPLKPVENILRIGSLELMSNHTSLNDMCSYALWLLQQDPIKQHLGHLKKEEIIKGASYVE